MTHAFAFTNTEEFGAGESFRTAMAGGAVKLEGAAGARLHETWLASAERRHTARRAALREYRVLSALAFVVLLPFVAASRLVPARWRNRTVQRSLIAETRARADAVIPIVFMA